MELPILDPFGDYHSEGYLRNVFKEKNLRIVGHLETVAFEAQIYEAIRILRRLPGIDYANIKATHKRLFDSVYPWAGQDRSENAPNIAIVKAGYKTLFAIRLTCAGLLFPTASPGNGEAVGLVKGSLRFYFLNSVL